MNKNRQGVGTFWAPWWRRLTGLLALAAVASAVTHLESARDGVRIHATMVGSMPVTQFEPAARTGHEPVVVVVHGFAGSQQLMQPFALTLARNGYVALTFDFPGHGRNAAPMSGGLADQDLSHRTLMIAMDQIGAYAGSLAGPDGRYAVVGHSMSSDIVVRHAQAHPAVVATVGVSMFAPSIEAATPGDSPRNLLVIDGGLEPAMMAREALRVVGRVGGAAAVAGTTYGSFDQGTARRAILSPGVEHIGVLYSAKTLGETLAWLDIAFGKQAPAEPFIDIRGAWLGLLLAGIVALAWPLAGLLPRLAAPDARALPRRRWWRRDGYAPLVLLPALTTPLILWKLPSDFLPILLGDYLVLHFALYGGLTIAGLLMSGWRPPRPRPGRARALALTIAATAAYGLLAVGLPLDRYVFNVEPPVVRLPLILALCAGTLLYFLADECLTRRQDAARGAYFCSKAAFLGSLVLAILLNPHRLFFLAIIVPAILLLFVIYGLFSRWVNRSTAFPPVAAAANALAFGWFIAVTFPLVG